MALRPAVFFVWAFRPLALLAVAVLLLICGVRGISATYCVEVRVVVAVAGAACPQQHGGRGKTKCARRNRHWGRVGD